MASGSRSPSDTKFSQVSVLQFAQRLSRDTIFGYFHVAGEDHDDVLLTADIEVPIRSPIAQIAHRVSADPGRVQIVGAMLRGNVTGCRCPSQLGRRSLPPRGAALANVHH